MYLVHVHRHHNIGIPESTLTPLASLNVQLDTLAEEIMAAFLLSPAKINKMEIGLSDLHRMTSISIHGDPIQYNTT